MAMGSASACYDLKLGGVISEAVGMDISWGCGQLLQRSIVAAALQCHLLQVLLGSAPDSTADLVPNLDKQLWRLWGNSGCTC